MKKLLRMKISIIALIAIVFVMSCSKEFDYGKLKNAVETNSFNNVTQTSVVVLGKIVTDNGAGLNARGICYGTNNNPTVSGLKVVHSSATLGDYSCTINDLAPSTTYYARAYATNSYGTAYGKSIRFTTLQATAPIISSTTSASLITSTSATTGGNITSNGASLITSRGVCYSSTISTPTTAGTKTNNGTGIGNFVSSLTGLAANTTYYIRAYAINGIGTSYGDIKTFRTNIATIPSGISTTIANAITQTTALSGGNITNDGGSTVISRGVCWSNTTSNPTVVNSNITNNGSGIGSFVSSLTNLSPNTTYYVRAYATNSVGTSYGNIVSFRTVAATPPTGIITTSASSITQTTANTGGSVAGDGGAAITSRGVCWSRTTSNPTIINSSSTNNGSGIGSFSSSLTALSPGTTYYVRAYATNSVGTSYGNVILFTTLSATIPTGVSTSNVFSISQNTANGGGTVTGDGGSAITSRGVCWSRTTTNPTIINSSSTNNGSGIGSFSSLLTALSPSTTYYVRAYATNSVGTSYGNVISFTTLSATIPTGVSTTSITSISQNSAISGGSVTGDGGSTITSRGFCWSSTNSSPTVLNSSVINSGSGVGSFSSSLGVLSPNTTYYVRAFATNSVGTAYGNTQSFTTLSNLSVGQSYQGGIIAYIFVSGDVGYVSGQTHGLITSTSNQSKGVQWGCSGT
jgi:hypothetical protein